MLMWFLKKKQVPASKIRTHIREHDRDVRVYRVLVHLKNNDAEFEFVFNNFDEAFRVKETIVSELTKGAKAVTYEHKGKNAVRCRVTIDGRGLSPNRYAIEPLVELQHITFVSDDISFVSLVDWKVLTSVETLFVGMTEKEFDDKTVEWHNSTDVKVSSIPLHEYIGLSQLQFNDIVEHRYPIIWNAEPSHYKDFTNASVQ